MTPEPLSLSDWRRLLLGNAPWSFLAEVALRVLVTYVLLTVTMRLLGKRMSGRLANLELAVMLLLGAIVSVPFQVPDRGLLPAALSLLCVLALQRGVSQLGVRFPKVERVTQNSAAMLIKDGVLVMNELRKASISPQQLFAVLRSKQIKHLGELKRVYLEGCGEFAIIQASPPRPGLSVLPPSERELTARGEAQGDRCVCAHCGKPSEARLRGGAVCAACGEREWTSAVASPA